MNGVSPQGAACREAGATPSHGARWIVPVLTVLATSGTCIAAMAVPSDAAGAVTAVLFAVLFGGGFALGVGNVVQAVVTSSRKRGGWLAFCRRALLLLKLGLVPFHLIGGLAVLAAALFSLHPIGAMMFPLLTMALPLTAFGWCIMACCSAWAFAYAIGAWRAGLLSAGACVAACVLSLFFVADVVCAVALFAIGRSRERAAAAWI